MKASLAKSLQHPVCQSRRVVVCSLVCNVSVHLVDDGHATEVWEPHQCELLSRVSHQSKRVKQQRSGVVL